MVNIIPIRDVKSKPQQDTTSFPLGWILSKSDTSKFGKDTDKLEPSNAAGGDRKGYGHAGNQARSSSKRSNRELPEDPVIPLLGKHPREVKPYVHRKMCT